MQEMRRKTKTLAAVSILREHLPNLKIRVVMSSTS